MKRVFLLVCFALLPVSIPALAKDGKACEAESARLPIADRDAHMKKCLAQLNDPSNVKQTQQMDKQARCEQNARNQQLQGSAKSSYISTCITSNEAAEAAKASPTSPTMQAKAPSPATKAATKNAAAHPAAGKPSKSCVKQANTKGLKGNERKQFLKDCK
ncbi:MAG TPA: PsiF family protein [Gallionellaceae bacterium]